MPFRRWIQTDSFTDTFTHVAPQIWDFHTVWHKIIQERYAMGRSQTDCIETVASVQIKPHIMGNKASITHHVTGHAFTKSVTTKGTSKREQVQPPQRHVDANCCSNFCAVGLLYRTPNWQEVTSLHKHLLRDAQAFGDMMNVSSRQTLTNSSVTHTRTRQNQHLTRTQNYKSQSLRRTQRHTNVIQC